MRLLIVGGLGYLASASAIYFANRDIDITLTSRSETTFKYPRVEIEQLDPMRQSRWSTNPNEYDSILFAAGPTSDACSADNQIVRHSACCVTNILDRLYSDWKGSFTYLSSAHVYRSPLTGLISENSAAENTHPYALSHRLAEKSLLNESKKHKHMKSRILRLSNVFGVPHNLFPFESNLFLNYIARTAVKDGVINITSNPQIKRNFIPMRYFLKGVEITLSDQELPRVLNLGWDQSITLQQAANQVIDRADLMIGKKVDLIIESEPIMVEDLQYKTNYSYAPAFKNSFFLDEMDALLEYFHSNSFFT